MDFISDALQPFFQEEGYVLYHQEFVKEGRDWYLRIFFEKAPETEDGEPGLVSTDDCEKVSRYLSSKLDEADPIEQNYYLEVSSPGMDRTLWTAQHYNRYVGQLVDVSLYQAVEGKKNWTGTLKEYAAKTADQAGYVILEGEQGKVLTLPLDQISRTKLTVVF